eukprot:g3389.t1
MSVVINVQEFEAAVLCAFNAPINGQSSDHQARAAAYCDQARASPQAWMSCLELLLHTSHASVQFAVLRFLADIISDASRWAEIPLVGRDKLRVTLLGWVSGNFATLEGWPLFLRQKIAVVIVKLIKREYPVRWPGAFADLATFLQGGPTAIHLWLRILYYIDEEIVEFKPQRPKEEHANNTVIKDTMRNGVVQQLVERMRGIILTYQSTLPDLAKECLETFQRYITWIDIGLSANSDTLGTFRSCLNQPKIRKAAVDCYNKLISKGMPVEEKLHLMSTTNVLGMIRSVPGLAMMTRLDPESPQADDEVSEFVTSLAQLCNSVGIIIFHSLCELKKPHKSQSKIDKGSPNTNAAIQSSRPNHNNTSHLLPVVRQLLRECIDIVWLFFTAVDDDVSEKVADFIHCIPCGSLCGSRASKSLMKTAASRASSLGRVAGNGAEESWLAEYDGKIVESLLRKMRFPLEFRFGSDDDSEVEFLHFRKRLIEIFRAIGRARPENTLRLLQQQLSPSGAIPLGRISELPHADVEVMLTLLYEYAVDNLNIIKTDEVINIISMLHSSNVAMHSHHAVVVTYYEVTERYSHVLAKRPVLIPKVLGNMLGPRGLQFPHATVRARSCYLLLRIVKKLGEAVRPYCNQLMQGVQAGVNIPHGPELPLSSREAEGPGALRFTDQLNLFELSGIILSADWIPEDAQLTGMQQRSNDELGAGLWISRALLCLARLSKSFNHTQISRSQGLLHIFNAICQTSVDALTAMPRHSALRSKLICLLHRMLVCSRQSITPFLPSLLSPLVTTRPEENCFDALEILQLLNQICSKMKADAAAVIDVLIMPICQCVFEVVPQLDDPSDAKSLRNSYYRFLGSLVENKLSSVLVSRTNGQHLNSILATLIEGCRGIPEFSKVCFSVLETFANQWLQSEAQSPVPVSCSQALFQFVCEKATPAIFDCVMQSEFLVTDATCSSVLNEISKFMKTVVMRVGFKYTEYLQRVFFPQISCPDAMSSDFCTHVTHDDAKKFKKYLRSFFRAAQPEKYTKR